MSFQVGIGFLGGLCFFQVGLCTPLRNMSDVAKKVFSKAEVQKKDKKRVWPYRGDFICNGGFKPSAHYEHGLGKKRGNICSYSLKNVF